MMYIPRAANGKDDRQLDSTGQMHEYTFCSTHVYSKHPPRFTLVWTDYPAAPNAEVTLVNDLDLEVFTDDGNQLHYGKNTMVSFDSFNNVLYLA